VVARIASVANPALVAPLAVARLAWWSATRPVAAQNTGLRQTQPATAYEVSLARRNALAAMERFRLVDPRLVVAWLAGHARVAVASRAAMAAVLAVQVAARAKAAPCVVLGAARCSPMSTALPTTPSVAVAVGDHCQCHWHGVR